MSRSRYRPAGRQGKAHGMPMACATEALCWPAPAAAHRRQHGALPTSYRVHDEVADRIGLFYDVLEGREHLVIIGIELRLEKGSGGRVDLTPACHVPLQQAQHSRLSSPRPAPSAWSPFEQGRWPPPSPKTHTASRASGGGTTAPAPRACCCCRRRWPPERTICWGSTLHSAWCSRGISRQRMLRAHSVQCRVMARVAVVRGHDTTCTGERCHQQRLTHPPPPAQPVQLTVVQDAGDAGPGWRRRRRQHRLHPPAPLQSQLILPPQQAGQQLPGGRRAVAAAVFSVWHQPGQPGTAATGLPREQQH